MHNLIRLTFVRPGIQTCWDTDQLPRVPSVHMPSIRFMYCLKPWFDGHHLELSRWGPTRWIPSQHAFVEPKLHFIEKWFPHHSMICFSGFSNIHNPFENDSTRGHGSMTLEGYLDRETTVVFFLWLIFIFWYGGWYLYTKSSMVKKIFIVLWWIERKKNWVVE